MTMTLYNFFEDFLLEMRQRKMITWEIDIRALNIILVDIKELAFVKVSLKTPLHFTNVKVLKNVSLLDKRKGSKDNWGHSNNTWHFFAAFLTAPPPPVWHYYIFNHWILALNCFEISNETETKYLLKLYLALWQIYLLPKAFKAAFQK